MYDNDTGAPFYDANGSASGGLKQFATLVGHPNGLTNADSSSWREAGPRGAKRPEEPVLSDGAPEFDIAVPAWRARRLRAHLAAQTEVGRAARQSGGTRTAPHELEHRAEIRRWLAGWDAEPAPTRPEPTPRQLAKLARWRTGAGRLRADEGELRSMILDAVADELLAARPLPFGAIAHAHRETVRRCRDAGLPAPKASRYRLWLKISRAV